MPGPYFKGQTAANCGCFFPDVVRLRDDFTRKKRILHCVVHGQYEIPLPSGVEKKDCSDMNPIPTDEWREKERQRLRSGG